jgi:ribosomal protein S1
VDDAVTAMVINVDERDKRIGLSIRAIKKAEEKKETETFQMKDESRALSTLGDFLLPAIRKNNHEGEGE